MTENVTGQCWNCQNTACLVLEPDPGMENTTDRVRCIQCGEMQDMDALFDTPVAGRDYEPAVCGVCGRDEHTAAELRVCLDALGTWPEDDDNDRTVR